MRSQIEEFQRCISGMQMNRNLHVCIPQWAASSGNMQRIWRFQSFSPPRSPLPTFPESQVNIKYSLLPWWQLKCWCAETHVYNLHFLCLRFLICSINLELETLSEVCAMILHRHSILYATTYLPHKHLLTLSEENLPFW